MPPKDISDAWPHGSASNTTTGDAGKRRLPYGPAPVQRTFSREPRVALRAEPEYHDSKPVSADGTLKDSGTVFVRRRSTPGGGGSDGGTLRQARGRGDLARPNFNLAVPPNGYAWWYIDGISNDGKRAISIIAFIGSVFSPWYKWSGRRNPDNHVCINVATYGPGGRFTMTDRGKDALRQDQNTFQVGPSSLRWTGSELVIDINEMGAPPMVAPVRGTIRLTPSAMTKVELPLTSDGAHIWRPFAPVAKISVNLEKSGWTWDGHGYFDANFGTRALEDDFSFWTWGRYPVRDGALCAYDANRLDGSRVACGLSFSENGDAKVVDLPPQTPFRRSLWTVRRETRADPGVAPRQVMNMLDAPFYSRSMVQTTLNGEQTIGVHEALDLKRFRSPFLKPMLAVRVPRRRGWHFDS